MKETSTIDQLKSANNIGRRKIFLTKREKINKSRLICELYSDGVYNLSSCCKAVSIPYMTFKAWTQPDLTDLDIANGNFNKGFIHEVNQMYKKAREENLYNFKEAMKQKIREGLLLKITGIDYEEIIRTMDFSEKGQQTIVSKLTSKKILPDTTALIFVAKSLGNEIFNYGI